MGFDGCECLSVLSQCVRLRRRGQVLCHHDDMELAATLDVERNRWGSARYGIEDMEPISMSKEYSTLSISNLSIRFTKEISSI